MDKGRHSLGRNSWIGENVTIGQGVVIGDNCIIEDHVTIGNNVYIDHNSIIRTDVKLGENSTIGANCIIGEYQMDFWEDRKRHKHVLEIGRNALIRSGSILYSGSVIGDHFQTGHHVTIRETETIGDHVSIGSFSDIQDDCRIGNYTRLHSNVFLGQMSVIEDCVWIFPHVVLTNDSTPPSERKYWRGVHIHSFAIVAANAVILPGIEVESDSLISAGALVSKNVAKYSVIAGNPGQAQGDIRNIKNKVTGETVYPWRHHFDRAMPWQDLGFDQWSRSLDEETRKRLLGETVS